MADVSVLNVKLYGEIIGTLTHVQGDRTLFSFTEAYVADPNRPTLGLFFKDDHGGLITNQPPTQVRVLPYFSNLLPEGHLREYLAERAGVNPQRSFSCFGFLAATCLARSRSSPQRAKPGRPTRMTKNRGR